MRLLTATADDAMLSVVGATSRHAEGTAMTLYRTRLAAAEAEYIAAIVDRSGGLARVHAPWPGTWPTTRLVTLDGMAVEVLRDLDPMFDGHLGMDGCIWIGGGVAGRVRVLVEA